MEFLGEISGTPRTQLAPVPGESDERTTVESSGFVHENIIAARINLRLLGQWGCGCSLGWGQEA